MVSVPRIIWTSRVLLAWIGLVGCVKSHASGGGEWLAKMYSWMDDAQCVSGAFDVRAGFEDQLEVKLSPTVRFQRPRRLYLSTGDASGTVVASDGEILWTHVAPWKEARKQPAPESFPPRFLEDVLSRFGARGLYSGALDMLWGGAVLPGWVEPKLLAVSPETVSLELQVNSAGPELDFNVHTEVRADARTGRLLRVTREVTYPDHPKYGPWAGKQMVTEEDYTKLNWGEPLEKDEFQFLPPVDVEIVGDFGQGGNKAQESWEGEALPAFRVKDLMGMSRDSEMFSGKPTLLYFWSTWCWPCLEELDLMQELFECGQDGEFHVFTLASDRSATLAAFLQNRGYTFPVLLDTDRSVRETFGIQGLPRLFFVDKEGRIAVDTPGALSAASVESALRTVGVDVTLKRRFTDEDLFVRSLSKAQRAYSLGREKSARKFLEELADQLPHHLAAELALTDLYRALDDCERARSRMGQLINLGWNEPGLLNNVAHTWAETDFCLESAEQLALRARAADPDSPVILDTLGWVQFKRGKAFEAERNLSRSIALEENDEVRLHWAASLEALGKIDRALAVYEKALELNPDNLEARESVERLREKP